MMTASGGIYYYAPALAMPCAPAFMPISSTERRLYPIFFQITITNDTDRANNYEVKSYMNFSTDLYQSPPVLIYKIVNGVQTFPVI